MVSYAALQSSIETAVDDYEQYKSQSLRLKLDNLSLGPASPIKTPTTPTHTKRSSLSIPALTRLGSKDSTPARRPGNTRHDSNDSLRPRTPMATGNYAAFINVARDHEANTFLIDLEFFLSILDFIRSQHPHTSNSLKNVIKQRHLQKRKLWTKYTTQMQGLAKSYSAGNTMPPPSPFDTSVSSQTIREKRREIKNTIGRMETGERTCAESLLSALDHNHAQALKDIDARYSMPDPIHDKTTPVEKHNERARVFNQLVKFVADDLGRIERETRLLNNSDALPASKKDKKGSGAVDAVESLCIEDYPPYK